jgi:hypothetical protein
MVRSVTSVRGQLWRCESIHEHKTDTILNKSELLVYPTFHPAAALYDNGKVDPLLKDFERLTAWLAENPDFD